MLIFVLLYDANQKCERVLWKFVKNKKKNNIFKKTSLLLD